MQILESLCDSCSSRTATGLIMITLRETKVMLSCYMDDKKLEYIHKRICSCFICNGFSLIVIFICTRLIISPPYRYSELDKLCERKQKICICIFSQVSERDVIEMSQSLQSNIRFVCFYIKIFVVDFVWCVFYKI